MKYRAPYSANKSSALVNGTNAIAKEYLSRVNPIDLISMKCCRFFPRKSIHTKNNSFAAFKYTFMPNHTQFQKIPKYCEL